MVLKKIFLLVLFLGLLPQAGLAIGLGVDPAFIEIDLEGDKRIEETKLTVFNLSQEISRVEVYPDELGDWFKIDPEEFLLEPQGQRVVSLVVIPQANGRRATNISVVAKPYERRGFTAGSGIKIPLRLNVSSLKETQRFWSLNFYLGLGVTIFSLFLFALGYYYRQRHLSLKRRLIHKLDFIWTKKRWRLKL